MLIRTSITGIGDPFILRVGSVYYAYATSAPDGFLVYTSENLTDWRSAGYCFRGNAWANASFWAPEVFSRGGLYHLLYTARRTSDGSLRVGLAVSDRPEGPFRDRTDGPLFDLGYAAIDATFFADDDGRTYLYYSRDCSENTNADGAGVSEIYGAEVDGDFRFLNDPVLLTTPTMEWEKRGHPTPPKYWNEGPALLKHAGTYYLNFSASFYASRDYCVGCAVSDRPLGPFVKYPRPVLQCAPGDFSGPGHNNFFRDEKGDLFTSFHIHTDPAHPSGDRRMCLARAGFAPDGIFFIDAEE